MMKESTLQKYWMNILFLENVFMRSDVIIAKRPGRIESDNRQTVKLEVKDEIALVKIDLPNAKVS